MIHKIEITLAPDWHPLSSVDSLLLATGWRLDPQGWWPTHWEKFLEEGHFRLAHYSRSNALMFEVARLEYTLKKQSEPEC